MSEFILVRAPVLAVSAVHQDAYLLDCALSVFLRTLLKFAPKNRRLSNFIPRLIIASHSNPHYLPQSPYERTGVRWRHKQIFWHRYVSIFL